MTALREELKDWFKGNEGVYYQRQVGMVFEEKYPHYRTRDALKKLIEEENWLKIDKEIWNGKKIYFYYSNSAKNVEEEKSKVKHLIKQLDGDRKGSFIGSRAKEVIERTLSRNGFRFISEDGQSYRGKTWQQDNRDLDLIFERGNMGYGVEVKNKNSPPAKRQINKKIEICEYLGLKLIYAARSIPQNRKEMLLNQKHGYICFGGHLLPPYFSKLDSLMRELEGFNPSTRKTISLHEKGSTIPHEGRPRYL